MNLSKLLVSTFMHSLKVFIHVYFPLTDQANQEQVPLVVVFCHYQG